eukprot:GEMP01020307.1.p1 GENE.GEMP01020307.1~~GEMP01020307.1.p1  ORF type:complete len:647 (+),score=154.49 GEMP01020307.1:95-2035(+)
MFLTDGITNAGSNAVRNVAINCSTQLSCNVSSTLFVCFEGEPSQLLSESSAARTKKNPSAFFAAGESGVEPVSPKKSTLKKLSRPRCVCTTATAVAVGYSSGAVRLWEREVTKKAELLAQVGCHAQQEVVSIQVGQGDYLISNGIHEVILWGRARDFIQSYRRRGTCAGSPLWRKTLSNSVEQAAVFPKQEAEHFLVACTQLHDVALFETSPERRRYLGRLKGHTGPVSCVRFGQWSGIWLFSGGFDGSVRIWTPKCDDDPLSIECVTLIQTSTDWIMDIALSEARQLVTVSSDRYVRVYSLKEEVVTVDRSSHALNGTWLDGRWSTNFGTLVVADGKGTVLGRLWLGNVAVKSASWYLFLMDVCDLTETAHGWWGEEQKGTCGQFTLQATNGDEFVGSFCTSGNTSEKEEWHGKRISLDANRNNCASSSFSPKHGSDRPFSPSAPACEQAQSSILHSSTPDRTRVFASLPAHTRIITARLSAAIEDNEPSAVGAQSSADDGVTLPRVHSINFFPSRADPPDGDDPNRYARGTPVDQEVQLIERTWHVKSRVCAEMELPEGGTCVDMDRSGRHIAVGTVGGLLCTWSSDWYHRRIPILVRAWLTREPSISWTTKVVLTNIYSRCGISWGYWPLLPDDVFRYMCAFI